MYHRKAIQTRLYLAVISTALLTICANLAYCRADSGLSGHLTKSSTDMWPQLPETAELKKHPVSGVEIYEYDNSPIGNRAPLLLVHGLDGENKDCLRWRQICNALDIDQSVPKKFKILFARYSTHIALADVVPPFQKCVAAISEKFGGKPITMVALSMGGNVIEQSMVDSQTSAKIERVLSMGTPFHGSPLFAANWMRFSMAKHYRLPLMRMDNCLPYTIYFDRHRNLLSDLPWDDTDNRVPDVGPFHFIFPYSIRGVLTPKTSSNPDIAKFNEPGVVDKSKFIVYGGYLNTLVAASKPATPWVCAIKYPAWLFFTKFPEHCGKEHPVLRVLNEHIAQAIPSSKITGQTVSRFNDANPYGLNDGICPLASALFLPNAVVASHNFRTRSDVPPLKHLVDVRKARVFDNIDHLTFIDGYTPRGRSPELKDELSPTAPGRSIFRWIITDLMDRPEQAQIAADPKKPAAQGKD